MAHDTCFGVTSANRTFTVQPSNAAPVIESIPPKAGAQLAYAKTTVSMLENAATVDLVDTKFAAFPIPPVGGRIITVVEDQATTPFIH